MNARRLIIANILIILVVIIAVFVGYYFYHQSTRYLKTNNAYVSGKKIVIMAPESGKIATWSGHKGKTFKTGSTVGDVQAGHKISPIDIPQQGTIVQNTVLTDETVVAGEPLAYAYNLNKLYVTANVNEKDFQNVAKGDTVDVYFDAFPGTDFVGTVKYVGQATASTFSMFPTASTTSDFTKVEQVVPVTIKIQSPPNGLAPGMSATVRIHK